MLNSPNIVFEDGDFVVFNKPSGIAKQAELSNELSLQDIYSKTNECYVINRIDKRISCLTIFAKNKKTAAYFSEIIKERQIAKKYRIIVSEKPEKS